MPMDENTRAIMAMIDAAFPKVTELSAAEVREVYANMTRTPGEPEAVGSVSDTDADGVPVRVYQPADPPAPRPLVVFFHGGGWVIGDLESHDALCRQMTNTVGCTTVSVDYRLAPDHPFPAAADDAYTATVWAAEHAAEIGADPARLAVAGDSAGGNLAAVVAHQARDNDGPPIRFQLLVYPVIDCDFETVSYRDNAEGYFLTRAAMQWYWDQYVAEAAARSDPRCSPLRSSTHAGLPEAYIVTAEFDPLRDEGEAYGEALRAAGVPVTLVRADGMFHGFFSMGAYIPPAADTSADAFAAMRKALA